MAVKGCWTCKDRKVSCDRAVPSCVKCAKTKRQCGGYGVRLTWPQEEHNRALIGHSPLPNGFIVFRKGQYHWINVVPTDIRLNRVTSTAKGKLGGIVTKQQLSLPNMPELTLNVSNVATNDLELIRYFELVVVELLPALYTDRVKICEILVQSALSNRGQSSRAIRNAMLALASYHRGNDPMEVERLKGAALRDLYTHSAPDMCHGSEHVAANLLLCVLEMQQTTGKNSSWIGYVSGVKQVIDAVKSAKPVPGCNASFIHGWVYYFDVMARFSFRHWRTDQIKAIANELGFNSNGSNSCAVQYGLVRASFAREIPNISAHAHPIVQLLFEVSDTAMYSTDPRYITTEYQEYLDGLRSRLESVSSRADTYSSSQDALQHTESLLELTRLAGLIYLERVSRNFSGQSPKIISWTRQGLDILINLESCLCPFALLIIGCETNTDEDRIVILDLYARMEKKPHFRSFLEVKALIQTAWNQQDLAEDHELEYIHKLNLVLSSRDVVPSLI